MAGTRRFKDAPDAIRCKADITLRDGSKAQCGRARKQGCFCAQHAKMAAKGRHLLESYTAGGVS